MRCWHCDTEVIWGGDHDADDTDAFDMVTNLSCPKCGSLVLVYATNDFEPVERDRKREPVRLDKTRDGVVLYESTVDRLVSLCLFLVGELQMQKEHRDEVIETIIQYTRGGSDARDDHNGM